MTESQENTMTGTIHVRLKHPHGIIFDISNGRKVALKGSDFHLRGMEKGILTCGFGKTEVSANDWEEVMKVYPGMIADMVRKGTLIHAIDIDSAEDAEDERKSVKHGREPVDVKNDKTINTKEVRASEAA